MPNINFELNLNKHPKDVPNRALVSANNVQLSGDLSCLQSEFCITENDTLNRILTDKYIAGYIPCNKEFILFLAPKDWKSKLTSGSDGIEIEVYRCREQGELNETQHGSFDNLEYKLIYNKLKWHGGEIKGTFTYNIKSQLILAIAEYDTKTGDNIPLKTINVGTWDDDTNTDLNLDDNQISLNPITSIPSIKDYEYKQGLAYKGWYYFFIRYKINNVDYTKWYSIGYPIFIGECEKHTLFNYGFMKANPTDYASIVNYMSSGSNTCNNTVELELDNIDGNFANYQLGFICTTKDNQRAFKSLDISAENKINLIDFSNFEEYSVNDLTFEKYNYYNVKNVINYKNRLYVSNYKEFEFDYNKLKEIADKINLKCIKKESEFFEQVETIKNKLSYIRINIGTWDNSNPDDIVEINRIINKNDLTTEYQGNPSFAIHTNLGDLRIGAVVYAIYGNKEIELVDTGTVTIGDGGEIIIEFNNNANTIKGKYILSWSEEDAHAGEGIINITNSVERFEYIEYDDSITYNSNIYKFDSNNILNSYKDRLKDRCLIPNGYYKFYIHFVNKYGEYSEGIYLINKDNSGFDKNSGYDNRVLEDNTLFHVPSDIYDGGILNTFIKYYLHIDLTELSIDADSDIKGFFLSYEKYKDINDFYGVLFYYDFYKTYTNTDTFTNYSKQTNKNVFRFYSNEIDMFDNLELKSGKLELLIKNPYSPTKTYTEGDYEGKIINERLIYEDKNTKDIKNLQSQTDFIKKKFDIESIKYVPAHSFIKSNDYRGSYLEITLKDDDNISEISSFAEQGIICRLLSNDANLYNAENKQLIKFTNVYKFEGIDNEIDISAGLNGFVTFNQSLIYNENKVILNTGYNIIVNENYYAYIGNPTINEDETKKINNVNHYPFITQYSFPFINDILYESKEFNKLPQIIITRTEALSDEKAQAVFDTAASTIVEPINSIDLYKLPIGSQDTNNPKIYVNHTIDFVNSFDKRVVRSNPIADESFENSWRTFSPEAYKDITENKGNITNIIALGTTFLVHTEHSLFIFDRDNTLRSGDGGTMQLSMPDVFDIDYKEVLASELGSCGLQDPKAWIVDEFGYMFYDNDAHKFYKFGAKNIEDINSSITQFIDKYKPFKVRFANDSESNRLLINIHYVYDASSIAEKTLSFNYKINKWISFHDYCFDRAFHTKQMVYLIIDKNVDLNNHYSNLYLINRKETDIQNKEVIKNLVYNKFENIRNLDAKLDYYYSDISIMINDKYELIKTLEFIVWKLYKVKMKEGADTNYNDFPREESKIPYSGYKLQVFNDNIDTGIINIEVDTEDAKNKSVMNYKKPWWQYDNWNLNYFRDIKNAKSQLAKYMSRLYGNYFIIRIWFGDTDGQRCEFETLDCKIINNPTI